MDGAADDRYRAMALAAAATAKAPARRLRPSRLVLKPIAASVTLSGQGHIALVASGLVISAPMLGAPSIACSTSTMG